MAGGIPIRFRRTISDTPIDPIELGGALWHVEDNKLGIMGQFGMCWYPGIDTKRKLFVLNQDQRFTGRDELGETSNLAIDFSTHGQLRIIDTVTDAVLATFSEAGAVFANPIVENVVGGGSFSKGSHPGFVPNLFREVDTAIEQGFVGPNTYLWKKAEATGRVVVKPSYKPGSGDLTHFSAEAFTLSYNAMSPTDGIGLRSWFFEPSLAYDGAPNNNKVFFSIWGPQGKTNTIRIGRNGAYSSITILGNNAWQRLAMDIPVHGIANSFAFAEIEPYAIDWFYNTTGGEWFLAEPTVQNVNTITNELYQYKSIAERMALADSYYWESSALYFEGERKKAINLPFALPALHSKATYDVATVLSEHTINVTEKSRKGFVVNTLDANPASQWTAKLRVGYRGPLDNL